MSKIRLGFVSNSSSSSFIVAVKKNAEATGKITITKEVDLKQYAEDTIDTAEKLYEYFYEQYDCKDDWSKETLKNYKDSLKAIANGMVILAGSFSDDGTEPEEAFLCMEGLQSLKSKDMIVIQSEGGY
jgi:hypothetical protein